MTNLAYYGTHTDPHPTPPPPQVCIMKDASMVYYGPFDEAAIAKHMPVDANLHDATVDAKESGVPADHKVQPGKLLGSCRGSCRENAAAGLSAACHCAPAPPPPLHLRSARPWPAPQWLFRSHPPAPPAQEVHKEPETIKAARPDAVGLPSYDETEEEVAGK